MGADPATIGDIILAVSTIGAGGLSSALAPNPYQKKNSFGSTLTNISAPGWLSDLHQYLNLATMEGFGKYNEGVDLSSTMPDGHSLPSFSGGTLPMRVGASSNIRPSSAAGNGTGSGPLPLYQQPGSPTLPQDTTITVGDDGPSRVFNPSQKNPGRWHTMLGNDSGGDVSGTFQQGQGAAQLLLHALTGGGGQMPRFA